MDATSVISNFCQLRLYVFMPPAGKIDPESWYLNFYRKNGFTEFLIFCTSNSEIQGQIFSDHL